jgi:Tol biopolymer transport system component
MTLYTFEGSPGVMDSNGKEIKVQANEAIDFTLNGTISQPVKRDPPERAVAMQEAFPELLPSATSVDSTPSKIKDTSDVSGKIYFPMGNFGKWQMKIYSIKPDGTGLSTSMKEGMDILSYDIRPYDHKVVFSGSAGDISIMNLDGSDVTQIKPANAKWDRIFSPAPRFSPNGKQIVFAGQNPTGYRDIFIMDVDGRNEKQLTSMPTACNALTPSFHPDGTAISFSGVYNADNDIVIMNSDGTNQKNITGPNKPGSVDRSPVFNPDGDELAFDTSHWTGSTTDIATFDVAKKSLKRLTNAVNGEMDTRPWWSPDGNKLVYISLRNKIINLYIVPADGGEAVQLTDNADPSVAIGAPVWLLDEPAENTEEVQSETTGRNQAGTAGSATPEISTKNFGFGCCGAYKFMDISGKRYFESYLEDPTQKMRDTGESIPFLWQKSKSGDLQKNGQLSEVLIDDYREGTLSSNNPLKLKEGYELAIKSIDIDSTKAYMVLSKNGQVVDDKVIRPFPEFPSMEDRTYYYKSDLGRTKGIVQIAVYFKNAFRGANENVASYDGVFQISGSPRDISA